MIRPIHPFPARMAPELAINALKRLRKGSVVLDPMMGSGTVLRHASDCGHHAIGFDMDPLAFLMSRVATTPVDDAAIEKLMTKVRRSLADTVGFTLRLPWIDDDQETREFVDYWFGEAQQSDLRRIAYILANLDSGRTTRRFRRAADVLRLALSRIIITKDRGASLARDVSHSRPHKVAQSSDFEVIPAFERSLRQVRGMLADRPPSENVRTALGDARSLFSLDNASVDAVLTSPPYLNAIDYLRGHRLALVWLGHRLSDLRAIRSGSIGSERAPDVSSTGDLFRDIEDAMCKKSMLSSRHAGMVARYAEDVYRMMSEIARVLKPDGRAILVVGNSCIKGEFVQNSAGIIRAAEMVGLRLKTEVERQLPTQRRYLPLPASGVNSLSTRMRTEVVVSFVPKRTARHTQDSVMLLPKGEITGARGRSASLRR